VEFYKACCIIVLYLPLKYLDHACKSVPETRYHNSPDVSVSFAVCFAAGEGCSYIKHLLHSCFVMFYM